VKNDNASVCLAFCTHFTPFPWYWTDQALWNLVASFYPLTGNFDGLLALLGTNKFS